MRIYLAARYTRGPEMREIAANLSHLGHVITSQWIFGDHDWDGENHERGAEIGLSDLEDLDLADLAVIFTPGGRRGGSHFEYGWAFAKGKSIVLVGPRQNVFHCSPLFLHFETPAAFLDHFRKSVPQGEDTLLVTSGAR